MTDRRPHEPGEDLHGLAAPYALDALSGTEREQFEAHLAACAVCRREVAELQEAAVSLSEGLELAPPADLRRRVLDQVATEAGDAPGDGADVQDEARGGGEVGLAPDRPRPPRRAWWLAAAAAVVVGAGTWGAVELLDARDPAGQVVQARDAQEYVATTPDGDVTVVASARKPRSA